MREKQHSKTLKRGQPCLKPKTRTIVWSFQCTFVHVISFDNTLVINIFECVGSAHCCISFIFNLILDWFLILNSFLIILYTLNITKQPSTGCRKLKFSRITFGIYLAISSKYIKFNSLCENVEGWTMIAMQRGYWYPYH